LFSLLTLTQLLGSPIDVELACLAVGVSSADIRDAAAGEARDMATMVQNHTLVYLKCRSSEICVCIPIHILNFRLTLIMCFVEKSFTHMNSLKN
jgi:hypothetical protein